MIITRTPLRISLGGGGTDLPSYYRRGEGGFLVAAAINKHIYIAVNRNFDDTFLLKYSEVERVTKPHDVEHPLLREALLASGVESGVEISSMADIPAGTGLGSSGAFTVGVLKALRALRRQSGSNEELAELACQIEIERLGAPVGKQDQYATAIGGVTAFEFRTDDSVGIVPVEMPHDAHLRLEENLSLFYTGVRRAAAEELTFQEEELAGGAAAMTQNLDQVREVGRESFETLQLGDLAAFARLMTVQWKLKFERAPTAMHQQVDRWIDLGLAAGAGGGKLIGAGGGGFLLFYSDHPLDVRLAMHEAGLEEVRFGFDYSGSTTIVT